MPKTKHGYRKKNLEKARKRKKDDEDSDHVVTAEDDMQYDEEMEEDANLRDETLEQQGSQNNFIIEESQLFELFKVCRHENCGKLILPDNIDKVKHGFYLKVTVRCSCKNPPFVWESTELVKGRVSKMDLMSIWAANTNGLPTLQLYDYHQQMNMGPLSLKTSYSIENHVFYNSVVDSYEVSEKEIRDETKASKRPIEVAGDGRFDSIGFSAFYCCYLILCTLTNRIIGFDIMSKDQVSKGSSSMEPLAAKRCLMNVINDGIRPSMFVTDRSTAVRSMLAALNKDLGGIPIQHEFDVWHLIRSFMGRIREIKSLREWHETIRNFLWFAFKKAEGCKETLMEYIDSIPFHISNQHSFPNNKHLKSCPHPPNYNPEDKSYRNVDDKGLRKLRNELQNPMIQRDLDKCVNFKHTGSIENINSTIAKYAPKRIFFGKLAMRAKVAMAILSHNENCNRPVARNEDGTPIMILQRMRHGGPRMRVKRVPRTNNWKKLVFQNFLLKFKNFDRTSIRQTSTAEERAKTLELRRSLLSKHESRYAREAQVESEVHARENADLLEGTSDRVNSLIFNDPLGLQPTNENEEEDIRIEFTEIDEEENEEEDITEEDISEQVDEILDFFSNI